MPRTVKLTYEFVKEFFEEHGCKMIDTSYKNARTHINYRCNCGNVSKIIFDSFRRGHRCKKCGADRVAKKQTFTFDYVYSYFKQHRCELLEKKYVNVEIKIKYRCECGSISFITFSNFRRGRRCMKCSIGKRAGKNHYEWVEDRVAFAERLMFKDRRHKILRNTLKRVCQKKDDKTCNLLGYSFEDLQKYIGDHPNWRNVKNRKWHLDHIYPIQAFVDYGISDIKLINCLDNLQPLGAMENLFKSDSYDDVEFEDWLEGKGYDISE